MTEQIKNEETKLPQRPAVLMLGDLKNGFAAVGPFESKDHAHYYIAVAQTTGRLQVTISYQVLTLQSPVEL